MPPPISSPPPIIIWKSTTVITKKTFPVGPYFQPGSVITLYGIP